MQLYDTLVNTTLSRTNLMFFFNMNHLICNFKIIINYLFTIIIKHLFHLDGILIAIANANANANFKPQILLFLSFSSYSIGTRRSFHIYSFHFSFVIVNRHTYGKFIFFEILARPSFSEDAECWIKKSLRMLQRRRAAVCVLSTTLDVWLNCIDE